MGLRHVLPISEQAVHEDRVGITDLLAMGLRPFRFVAFNTHFAKVGITDLLAMGLRRTGTAVTSLRWLVVGITDLLAMGLRLWRFSSANPDPFFASWNHRPTCDGIETNYSCIQA